MGNLRPPVLRLLKPDHAGDIDYMQADKPVVSGGESLTGALFIYMLVVGIGGRATNRGGVKGGFLILDNPFGRATRETLLNAQAELADAMGIQLIYTVQKLNDHNALSAFSSMIQLVAGHTGGGFVLVTAARARLRRTEGGDAA